MLSEKKATKKMKERTGLKNRLIKEKQEKESDMQGTSRRRKAKPTLYKKRCHLQKTTGF